jgi:broad specificity polyphosphatase/5'/3'-nucleotidase SurE
MKILINNDDGYQSLDQKVLAREAETRGEIIVAEVDGNPGSEGNPRLRAVPMRHGPLSR